MLILKPFRSAFNNVHKNVEKFVDIAFEIVE